MQKFVITCISIIFLIVLAPDCVKAENTITLLMEDTESIGFMAVKVADQENGIYKLTENFSGCTVELNGVTTAAQMESNAKSCKEFIKDHHIRGDMIRLDGNGRGTFDSLSDGVYLIVAEEHERYEIMPMLVAVPSWDERFCSFENTAEVFPKYQLKPEIKRPELYSPKTGDDNPSIVFMGLLMFFGTFFFIGAVIVKHVAKK